MTPGASTRLAYLALCLGLLWGCSEAERDPADWIEIRETLANLLDDPAAFEVLADSTPLSLEPVSVSPWPPGRGESRQSLALSQGAKLRIQLPYYEPGAVLSLALAIPNAAHAGWSSVYEQATELGLEISIGDRPPIQGRLGIGMDLDQAQRNWKQYRFELSQETHVDICVRQRPHLAGVPVALSRLELTRLSRVPRRRLEAGHPGLVFVTVDTLRADRLSLAGYARPTSPELDRLAAQGLVFSHALAPAPWTWPSTASLLTGQSPPEHGVLSVHQCVLSPSLVTLGESLQSAGFTTGFFTTNPLLTEERGFGQGFERFLGGRWERGDELIQAAEEFLDRYPGRRFALYFQPTQPHLPYQPDPEQRLRLGVPQDPDGFDMTTYERGAQDWRKLDAETRSRIQAMAAHASWLYDAEVASADAWFGRLRAVLERRGIWDESLLAVTSDHGEELFEHGLPSHALQLYPESLRVPLILAGKRILPGQCSWPVSTTALPGTLLRALGLRVPQGFDPTDLVAVALGQATPPEFVHSATDAGWWPAQNEPVRLLSSEGPELNLIRAASLPRSDPWSGGLVVFESTSDPERFQALDQAGLAERDELLRRQLDELTQWWSLGSKRAPRVATRADTEALLRAAGYLPSER